MFIAAQGPLAASIPHFLEMIHEQKVGAIVMLTNLEEKRNGEKNNVASILIIRFMVVLLQE